MLFLATAVFSQYARASQSCSSGTIVYLPNGDCGSGCSNCGYSFSCNMGTGLWFLHVQLLAPATLHNTFAAA
jgi:hypothetical protein